MKIETFFKNVFGLTAIVIGKPRNYGCFHINNFMESKTLRRFIHDNDLEVVKYHIEGDFIYISLN